MSELFFTLIISVAIFLPCLSHAALLPPTKNNPLAPKPTLSVPNVATLIQAKTAFGSTYKFIIDGVIFKDIKTTGYMINTTFNGSKVQTPIVRVSMWANKGSLYLNQDVLELADFNDCSSRYQYMESSNWKCRGRGKGDRNMTFVSTSDSVNKLLNGMTYSPFHENSEDFITIEIFEGQEGDCLTEAEQVTENYTTLSILKGCFEVRAQIFVPPLHSVEANIKPNIIEKALGIVGLHMNVNLVSFICWLIIVAAVFTLYENILQCMGCLLPKKCLAWFSFVSWGAWLLCGCGMLTPTEQVDDWPYDEEISCIHISDGFLYEKSKHRAPSQWRKSHCWRNCA